MRKGQLSYSLSETQRSSRRNEAAAGGQRAPTTFISCSWDTDEHKNWVESLAARLRSDGIEVTLDRRDVAPGDRLPHFMETAVRENDFVLLICTPEYRRKSDHRSG